VDAGDRYSARIMGGYLHEKSRSEGRAQLWTPITVRRREGGKQPEDMAGPSKRNLGYALQRSTSASSTAQKSLDLRHTANRIGSTDGDCLQAKVLIWPCAGPSEAEGGCAGNWLV
jgi:hypothetical protein